MPLTGIIGGRREHLMLISSGPLDQPQMAHAWRTTCPGDSVTGAILLGGWEKHQVTVAVGDETQPRPAARRRASGPDREALAHRMATDHYLCVFCKAPAEEVHHVSYENYGHETDDDLRSLCRTCHRACSMLEYGHDMGRRRVDPLDPTQRSTILNQIGRLLKQGRPDRWRELLTAARTETNGFFDAAPEGVSHEER